MGNLWPLSRASRTWHYGNVDRIINITLLIPQWAIAREPCHTSREGVKNGVYLYVIQINGLWRRVFCIIYVPSFFLLFIYILCFMRYGLHVKFRNVPVNSWILMCKNEGLPNAFLLSLLFFKKLNNYRAYFILIDFQTKACERQLWIKNMYNRKNISKTYFSSRIKCKPKR